MFLAATLLSGTAIFVAIWLLGAAYCFWTVRATEAGERPSPMAARLSPVTRWTYSTAGRRQFALFILPLAWVSYVPALYLLDRADRSGLPTWLPALTPLAAVIALALAGLVWSIGVRHYQSTPGARFPHSSFPRSRESTSPRRDGGTHRGASSAPAGPQ